MMLTASATVASTETDAASGSQSSRTLIKDLHPVVRPDWTRNCLEGGYYDLPRAAVKGVGHKNEGIPPRRGPGLRSRVTGCRRPRPLLRACKWGMAANGASGASTKARPVFPTHAAAE